MRDWIEATGRKIPDDIGLAHVDLGATETGWSGVSQRQEDMAVAAVDLLTAQLLRNELGPPAIPIEIRVEGEWIQGQTTRAAARQG